eukprot:TRINITY_DN9009_c0_g1_i1.p1 TRINITY_DN9009_c0_g1~~TRINITY_DN9009_c0_g1_i1.p1  ORF type:complete len:360 (+),score=52.06 TRINITY_DN9009_c0_g1_i1:42-1121(+)
MNDLDYNFMSSSLVSGGGLPDLTDINNPTTSDYDPLLNMPINMRQSMGSNIDSYVHTMNSSSSSKNSYEKQSKENSSKNSAQSKSNTSQDTATQLRSSQNTFVLNNSNNINPSSIRSQPTTHRSSPAPQTIRHGTPDSNSSHINTATTQNINITVNTGVPPTHVNNGNTYPQNSRLISPNQIRASARNRPTSEQHHSSTQPIKQTNYSEYSSNQTRSVKMASENPTTPSFPHTLPANTSESSNGNSNTNNLRYMNARGHPSNYVRKEKQAYSVMLKLVEKSLMENNGLIQVMQENIHNHIFSENIDIIIRFRENVAMATTFLAQLPQEYGSQCVPPFLNENTLNDNPYSSHYMAYVNKR